MKIRQKIFDMLMLDDFNHLTVHTDSTINHITKTVSDAGNFQWILQERVSELVTVRNYFSAEALVHEIYAYFKIREEKITKILTLLINFGKLD